MAASPWATPWLLRGLTAFLAESDVYRLWLVALEWELPTLRDHVALRSPYAPLDATRASHYAMASGCWTALCRLHGIASGVATGRYRLSPRIVDQILAELARLAIPFRPTPYRRLAMLTTATLGAVPEWVMYAAVESGHLESVVWLHYVAAHDPARALEEAACHGHAAVLDWLLEHGRDPPSNHSCRRIGGVSHWAFGSDVRVVVWNHSDTRCNTWQVHAFSSQWGYASETTTREVFPLADMAAQHGDLDAMKQILASPDVGNAYSVNAVHHAARGGHLHILQWLQETHLDAFDGSIALKLALARGHLGTAQWLFEQRLGGVMFVFMSEVVAERGHLHVLQWMIRVLPEIRLTSAVASAARAGHSHVVQWLIESTDCVVTLRHVKAAANAGHAELTQWLLARCNDDMNLSVAISAAAGGNATLVQWLVEQYDLWDPILFACACRASSTATLEYLYSVAAVNASELGVSLTSILRVKREAWLCSDQYETLLWLLDHGFCDGLLTKRSFDRMIYLERQYAMTQQQLGWTTDCEPHGPSMDKMSGLRRVITAVIRVYNPATLRKIPWLPVWAVRQRSLLSLQRLFEIRHPQVLSPRVFRLVLRETNDQAIVKWMLLQKPDLFTIQVVKWANRFDYDVLLHWIVDEFLPARIGYVLDSRILEWCHRLLVSSGTG